jgi:hypothetical protein
MTTPPPKRAQADLENWLPSAAQPQAGDLLGDLLGDVAPHRSRWPSLLFRRLANGRRGIQLWGFAGFLGSAEKGQ